MAIWRHRKTRLMGETVGDIVYVEDDDLGIMRLVIDRNAEGKLQWYATNYNFNWLNLDLGDWPMKADAYLFEQDGIDEAAQAELTMIRNDKLQELRRSIDRILGCPKCGSNNGVLVAHGVDEVGEWESCECEDCHYVWVLR